MKINSTKRAFSIKSSKFIGFMVVKRGIEANLEKIGAIMNMNSPKNLNTVEKLIERMVSLNMFMSWPTCKCLLFFRELRKIHTWNKEFHKAFKQFKKYLSYPLSSPNKYWGKSYICT